MGRNSYFGVMGFGAMGPPQMLSLFTGHCENFQAKKMNSTEQLLLADMKEHFSEFRCTLQDLRNPTEEFVKDFYSFWLQEFEVDLNSVGQKMNSTEQLLLADMKEHFSEFRCTLQDLRNPTEEFVKDFYSFWLQEFEVDLNSVGQKMNSTEQLLLADMKEHFSEFRCTLQDLRNPTEEFVKDFYSFWLQEFEVDLNSVGQTQFSQTEIVSKNVDAYSGTIPKNNLLRAIRAFDVVPDFGMLDIISPTPKRTQNILRAFINFYIWSDYRVSNIISKKKELNERKQMRLDKTNERETLRENINTITKNIPQIQDAKIQLDTQVDVMTEKLTELRQEKQLLKIKTDESNVKLTEKENLLQKYNKEDNAITNKIKEYSNLVVNSPSVILSDLESLRLKHDEMKDLKDQKRDMVESKLQAHNKLENLLREQKQRAELLAELLKLLDHHRERLQIVSTIENNSNMLQEQLTELKSTLLALNNKKRNRQEALQSLYLRWKTLKPQLTDSFEVARRDLADKKNSKNKMIDSLKEDATVQENTDLIMKKIKEHLIKLKHDYHSFEMGNELFHKTLKRTLENEMEDVRKKVEKKKEEQKTIEKK